MLVTVPREESGPEGGGGGEVAMDEAVRREEGEDVRCGEVEGYASPGVLGQVEQHGLAISGGENASRAWWCSPRRQPRCVHVVMGTEAKCSGRGIVCRHGEMQKTCARLNGLDDRKCKITTTNAITYLFDSLTPSNVLLSFVSPS